MESPNHALFTDRHYRTTTQRQRDAVCRWVIVVGLSLLTSCASMHSASRFTTRHASDPDEQTAHDPVAAAFRAGMETGLSAYAEHYLDNDFPYYNWSTPLVQRTWIPPRITGGVFYPGHMAEVLITPGAWKREYAAPISSHRGVSAQRRSPHERPVGEIEGDGPPDGPFPFARSGVATPLQPSRYSTSAAPTQAPVGDVPPPPLQRRAVQLSLIHI